MTGSKSSRSASDHHPPRMRGIQYAAAHRLYRWRLWNAGSPGHMRAEATPSFGRLCQAMTAVIQFSNSVVHEHSFAISRPDMPEVCQKFPCPPIRGRREAGRPMRPIAACAMVVVERTRVSQVTPEITRHSPRNGLRLISCSPRRPALLPPSPTELLPPT
jgi:hypothetical protein